MISYEPLFRTMKKNISALMNLQNGDFPVLLIMPLNREKALLPTQSISFVLYCAAMFPILWSILKMLQIYATNYYCANQILQNTNYFFVGFLACFYYNSLNILSIVFSIPYTV